MTRIIAEMACSHDGNINNAKKIIKASHEAHADMIQFQIWKLKESVVPYHKDYNKLKKLELSYNEWTELYNYAKKFNLKIIACINEKKSFEFCQKLNIYGYKLHSSDLLNFNLISEICKTNKEIHLSIGSSTLDEIQKSINFIKEKSNCKLILMYGYQNFPTKINYINLNYMKKISELFELPIGYQDHTDANTLSNLWISAAACGMEINIIEKHITHDRSKLGADHEAALNPSEFKTFVKMIKEIDIAKGSSIPQNFSQEEEKYRKYSKKSIVASIDLSKGKILSENDILFMRTGQLGIISDDISQIIGKKINCDIKKYEMILPSFLI